MFCCKLFTNKSFLILNFFLSLINHREGIYILPSPQGVYGIYSPVGVFELLTHQATKSVIHGYRGLYMVIEGYTWLYMAIEGYTWLLEGYTWL